MMLVRIVKYQLLLISDRSAKLTDNLNDLQLNITEEGTKNEIPRQGGLGDWSGTRDW